MPTINLNDFQYQSTNDLGQTVQCYLRSSASEIQINPTDKRIVVISKIFGSRDDAENGRKCLPAVLRIEGENYYRFLAEFGEQLFNFFAEIAAETPFLLDHSDIIEVKDKDGNTIASNRKITMKSLVELNAEEIPVQIEIPDEILKKENTKK